jgi:hypothetical protein
LAGITACVVSVGTFFFSNKIIKANFLELIIALSVAVPIDWSDWLLSFNISGYFFQFVKFPVNEQ